MTPDAMLTAWRDLLAAGHAVALEPTYNREGKHACYCCIDIYDADDIKTAEYSAVLSDPLMAFEAAYRAYREAQQAK